MSFGFAFYLWSHGVCANAGPQLDEEDEAEQDGEGHGHAVVLLDGPAAPEEGHEEDDAANDDEEDRRVEEAAAEKVQVLAVDALDHGPGDD